MIVTRDNIIGKAPAAGTKGWLRAAGIASTLALTLLAGCQQEWVKRGASQQDARVAYARCESDAYQRLPAMMIAQQTSPAGYTSGGIECTRNAAGGNDCKQKQVWRDATYITRDANSDGREAMIRSCMLQGGWTEKDD